MKSSKAPMGLDLEIQANAADPSRSTFEIRWKREGATPTVFVRCGSVDELRQAVRDLVRNLEGLVHRAEEAVQTMEAQQKADEENSMSPSDIWQQMEQASSEEAMFACFNALSEPKRREVAEWILTHVSMFKGRGPIFAEHYNIVTHTLDE
ncbi:hypothetical protein [Desulfosoma caldarium]|uniref:Uncharacterized protein n=1 Tax=Desulfosoma caldarium TaxID=610254 RepID=A0A3N1UNF8_9BACT|nr:hypothetical protein [Desulfosoma caldarium]ROQ90260.1 hypothetical protein EDC27_2882 [Desulfosoma caldarium]